MSRRTYATALLPLLGFALTCAGADTPEALRVQVEKRVAAVEPSVVAWRRDFHANPELGNRETRTAAIVAEHLRRLGLEVHTGVGVTGVVGVLKGARPGTFTCPGMTSEAAGTSSTSSNVSANAKSLTTGLFAMVFSLS